MEQSEPKKLNQDLAQSFVEYDPAVKAVTKILAVGIEQKASDIFIEPMPEAVRVRYRIDGVLYERLSFPPSFYSGLISRTKIISGLNIAEHRLPQDGRLRMQFRGNNVDFRVSVMPTTAGEKIVFRILDKQCLKLEITNLGFDERTLSLFKKSLAKPFGMILVCGPTGCGKTTTLYSALTAINSVEKNIVTIEDPIEYELFGLKQLALRENLGLTFAAALRSILRQDPNIILVGEIRDSETADIAVKAALTGHLILSTLHTTSAAGSLVRLSDMGIEPFLISSSCLLIASQVLLRALCLECRKPYPLSPQIIAQLKQSKPDIDTSKVNCLYRADGCAACNNTGYKGRVALAETMEITPKIRELIVTGGSEIDVREAAQKEGMVLLRGNAVNLAIDGSTSLDEVIKITNI